MQTLQQFKCPACGGSINYDSRAGRPRCPYCDTEFDIDALLSATDFVDAEDDVSFDTVGDGEWREGESDELRAYVCASCGGELVTDENTAATVCPFCGNAVVLVKQLSGVRRPDLVIPFKLDKKAACAALERHMKGKRLLPREFRDKNRIEQIKGIYIPFWLFDAEINANLHYSATKVREWSDDDYNYRETKHYSVIRAGNIGFAGVPVDGSLKTPDELTESIEPFDLSEAVDFHTAYLAGFLADKYDVSAEECSTRAEARIRSSAEAAFASTVSGYSSVTCDGGNIRTTSSRASYALLPVWLLTTKYADKNYTFAMNGQTGRFVGDLPVSRSAALKWFFGLAVGICAVSYGIAWILRLLGVL